MTQEEVAALLGRPLSSTEVTNFDSYLSIASDRLVGLLCSSFASTDSAENRMFESREGYSTVFTDIFSELTSVSIDGETVDADDYEVRQFDNLNGTWYNSLVFNKRFTCNEVVTVNATWGFDTIPSDLQLLWARLFALNSSESSTDGRVHSQRIDDAQVTFRDATQEEQFYKDNRSIIQKYSLCEVGNIRHGKVGHYYGRI